MTFSLSDLTYTVMGHPDMEHRLNMSSAIAYPIPNVDNPSQIHLFAYNAHFYSSRRTEISYPTWYFLFTPSDGRIAAIQNGADFFTDIPSSGFPTIVEANTSIEERRINMETLGLLYPTLLDWYPDMPADVVGEQFEQLFNALVPAPLMPFYKQLNPHFWQWLGQKLPLDELS